MDHLIISILGLMVLAIFNCAAIVGLSSACTRGRIGYPIRRFCKRFLPWWVADPLIDCPTCMSTIWATSTYIIMVWWYGILPMMPEIHYIWLGILYWFAVSGLDDVVWRKMGFGDFRGQREDGNINIGFIGNTNRHGKTMYTEPGTIATVKPGIMLADIKHMRDNDKWYTVNKHYNLPVSPNCAVELEKIYNSRIKYFETTNK